MKALELQASLNPDGTLDVPESVVSDIPVGQALRVLVLMPESDTDQEWEQRVAQDFGLGYSDSDAIYDQLSTR